MMMVLVVIGLIRYSNRIYHKQGIVWNKDIRNYLLTEPEAHGSTRATLRMVTRGGI